MNVLKQQKGSRNCEVLFNWETSVLTPQRSAGPTQSLQSPQREGSAYLARRQLLITALGGPILGCWAPDLDFDRFGAILLLRRQAHGRGQGALAEREHNHSQ